MMITQEYTSEAVTLLSHLIATPSISRNEQAAAEDAETAFEFEQAEIAAEQSL